MIVVSVNNCPAALKGDLTKWLLEINPGVYVGQVSARVRENLWDRICRLIKDGKAIMVFNAQNEQHLDFRVHGSEWEPIEFDGIKLVLRPSPARIRDLGKMRLGYSKASKYRKAKRIHASS